MAHSSRLFSYVVTISVGLLLLCACALSERPTATSIAPSLTASPATTVPVVPTPLPLPAYAPSPSPPSPIESERKPQITTDHGSSDADLEIQALESSEVIPGQTATYTLTIHNHGPGLATGIVVTNVLPLELVPAWTQPAHSLCERQGSTVRCDLGDVRASDTAIVTLDLSTANTESPAPSTQLAGVTVESSAPSCATGQDAGQAHVTCYLAYLEPEGSVEIRIGATVNAQATGTLAHTVTVRASEDDPDEYNNRRLLSLVVDQPGPEPGTAIVSPPDLVIQADGPPTVFAGQSTTYTYTITNQGETAATGVTLEDVVPSDMDLVAYAPGLPHCHQSGDRLTCYLHDPDTSADMTFTLVITGHGEQPMSIDLDPIVPGWPICSVITETTYLRILHCDLGTLQPSQTTRVQMALSAIGVVERITQNTAAVWANEADLNPGDNAITTTMEIEIQADLMVQAAIPDPAPVGEPVTYTLVVTNGGPSDADDVVLIHNLPASVQLVPASPSQGDECQLEESDSGSAVLCDIGRLEGGQATTVTVAVAVDGSLALTGTQALTHTVTVTAKPVDPDPSNNVLTISSHIGAEDED